MHSDRRLAILFLAVGLTFAGCAARQKSITNLPAGVTQSQVQNWDSAVANLDKISQVVTTVRQSVIALNQATVTDSTGTHKVIPDGATYAALLTSLGKIAQLELDAATFLKAQPNNWNASTQAKVQSDIALIQQELSTITAQQLPGIKNANAQAQLQTFITEIGSLAALILGTV